MKLHLDQTAREWQEKARRFAEDELIPWEVEAEMNDGKLPPDVSGRHRQMALDLGFSRMDAPEFPIPIGVFRAVERTSFDAQMSQQIEEVLPVGTVLDVIVEVEGDPDGAAGVPLGGLATEEPLGSGREDRIGAGAHDDGCQVRRRHARDLRGARAASAVPDGPA